MCSFQHSGYVKLAEEGAGCFEAFGGEEAHDADGEVEGADRADSLCRDGKFGGDIGGGDYGGEALEGGLELGF